MIETISVVGLGYVGLPTASILATVGFRVFGTDVNADVRGKLRNGDVHIEEPGLNTLVKAAFRSGFLAIHDEVQPADAFIIAVPTPVTEEQKTDLSYVETAIKQVALVVEKGNLIVVESTCPPGTTAQLIAPIIEEAGFVPGEEILLSYSPERVLPGRILTEIVTNDRIIGGINRRSAESTRQLYSTFVDGEIFLTDSLTAEIVKLAENSFRDTNIAFANSLARICQRLGANTWDVIKLANRHPRVEILSPGPGVGGHCIPVDPWMLVEVAKDAGSLLALSRTINDSQPQLVAEMALASVTGISDPVVTILGIAYKENIDDTRRTPAIAIIKQLEAAGCRVKVCDPVVKKFSHKLLPLESALRGADCAVLLVQHRQFQYLAPEQLKELMRTPVIFDTRNCLRRSRWEQLGFKVISIDHHVS